MYLEPEVEVGHTCKISDICIDINAICRNGRCMCRNEFGLHTTVNICGEFDWRELNDNEMSTIK